MRSWRLRSTPVPPRYTEVRTREPSRGARRSAYRCDALLCTLATLPQRLADQRTWSQERHVLRESGRAGMPEINAAIVRTNADTPLVDVMGGASRMEVKIHDHGFVALVDAMPRLVPE